MSTEDPVLLFAQSSPPRVWLDMAAAMVQSAVAAGAPSRIQVFDDGLLSELMDFDSISTAHDQGPEFPSPWLISSMPPDGIAFSFDSGLLEELLGGDNDVSSSSHAAQAPSDHQQLVKRASFAERLKEALRLIACKETEALAQVWVPVVQDDRVMLTTREQPYSVMHSKFDLLRYRSLSTGYIFPSKSDDSEGCYPGLPGRVFSTKSPEWTPNVQLYNRKEYLRIQEAACCDIKGLVAVPVIDPSSRCCLAVIELVTNVEKVEFGSEISVICEALQAVNLAGAPKETFPGVPRVHLKAVYDEISEVLRSVCESHKLPVAITWLPCMQNGKGGEEIVLGGACADSENISLFTKDAPFYVSDPRYAGFHEACSKRSLKRGEGVAGKAMVGNLTSFVSDVRSFSIEEYPLVHHARYFKLAACVAIRLRSIFTGAADYVVEFFLPLEITQEEQQQLALNSISSALQRVCRSLRPVSAEELRVETVVPTTKKHPPTQETASEAKSLRTKKLRQNGECDETSHDSSKRRLERKRSLTEKTIGLDVLQQYFAGSLKDAAKSIGVCPTTLKRICRQYGISRWPSRKINKVSRSLIKLQGVIDSVQGLDGAVKLNQLTGELSSAAAAAAAITKRNSGVRCADENLASQEMGGDFAENLTSNNIKDLSSDEDFRTSDQQNDSMAMEESSAATATAAYRAVKVEWRVHGSSAALAALNCGGVQQSLSPELNASRVEGENSSGDCASPSSPMRRPGGLSSLMDTCMVTVKATRGADTTRFRIAYTGLGYGRLREEISSRFKVDLEGFTLKYLDDDSEWVMLDGEADLEECLDVMKASNSQTIKLVIKDRSGNGSSHSLSSVHQL